MKVRVPVKWGCQDGWVAELQRRGRDIEDNSEIIFSYFPSKTYVVTPHYNRLTETVLTRGHNACFYGKRWKIILKLSLLLLLIWSSWGEWMGWDDSSLDNFAFSLYVEF